MTNRRRINVAVRNLEFFTNLYQFLVQILPIMVVSKQYFTGEISLGIISQSVGAFAHILSDMSVIVTQFEQLSSFCAGIERLSTFFQAMRRARSRSSNKSAANMGDDNNEDEDSYDTCSLLHVPDEEDPSLVKKHQHGRNGSDTAATSPQPLPDYGSIDDTTHKTIDDNTTAPPVEQSSTTEPVAATSPSTTAASLDTEYVPMGDHTQNHAGGKNGAYGTISLETHDTMADNISHYFSQTAMPSTLADVGTSSKNNIINNKTIMSIHRLDLCTPDRKRLLIKNLTLQILTGQHLLIVGNSGAGKSSLLRAIAGLWTVGNGQIQRPCDDQVYFLPQRPYCTVGTLKDQLLYPSCCQDDDDSSKKTKSAAVTTTTERRHDTEYLLSILQQVDLWSVASRLGNGDAVAGLDTTLDWTNVLSLGEQQRLAFGRLLVNRPRLAILDESTSALDMASEARMYALLQQQTAPAAPTTMQHDDGGGGLTYISVGHRPSLVQYHDKRLRLMGQHGYELSDIIPGMTS
jgi:ABC-type uncharacterized transport system fused permease/ATPase subunit